MSKFFISAWILAIVSFGTPGLARAQVGTGCCFTAQGYCQDGLSQLACDSSYTSGSAGTNYHAGQSCSTVSQCNVTGKCEQSGGANCQNLQKWQCDAKGTSGYTFFQGQTCGVAAPAGSCCVEPPSAGQTTNFCQENVDKTTCDARNAAWYNRACSGVSQCPQATTGAPPNIQENPTSSKGIIFTPEIPLPGFVGGPVTGQTIADYIRAVFVYFIWSVGLLATFMVIYGGMKWVSAAGNPGRINDARETINNAIIGLIIALTSVLLLNTISPHLTEFQGITLKRVDRQLFDGDNAPGEHNEAATCVSLIKKKAVAQETTCAVSKDRFAWPVGDSPLDISSRVGKRACAGCSSCHPGTDFKTAQKTGQPIIAVFSGTIQDIGSICGEPAFKLVSQDGKYYAKYLHVSSLLVKSGDTPRQGSVIGYSGGAKPQSTCSQGPHLHLELYDSSGEIHDIAPCVLQ